MNEAEMRAKIEAELRSEMESQHYVREAEERERLRMNAALSPIVQSARRPENSGNARVENFGTPPGDIAKDYAAVLWAQMEAGMSGTAATDDGYGEAP